VPVTVLGSVTNLITVRPEIGGSVADLIALARQFPGKITYGSQGNGSTPHLTANLFMNMTGTKFIHVPYRGENLVINDMVGGHVDVFFGGITPVLSYYDDGKLKVLAVADVRRATLLPDVPTAVEAGLPGFKSTSWLAVAGTPKMPQALAQQIAADFIAVVNMPDVQAKYRLIGSNYSAASSSHSPSKTGVNALSVRDAVAEICAIRVRGNRPMIDSLEPPHPVASRKGRPFASPLSGPFRGR
jgi:tripartite-type tricarboxylate transporter receptor subunit TctC